MLNPRVKGGVVFCLLIPVVTIWLGLKIDAYLGWSLDFGSIRYALSCILILFGGIIITWALIYLQRRGHGTPSPEKPPKDLVTDGPYGFVRHPMFLGYFICGTGSGILFRSLGVILITLPVLIVLSIAYLKREENILIERFKDAYRIYSKKTPFIVPHLYWKR
ncbi:MAG: hypothetical protein AUJ75_04000 [Candidatus Omnitrophica bacterium CG1_02_49_10]|nr:MAG: hypothetical protein AUJ75_04000 [Candidatus Omnitrophica bacterium CG1_02_49_10]